MNTLCKIGLHRRHPAVTAGPGYCVRCRKRLVDITIIVISFLFVIFATKEEQNQMRMQMCLFPFTLMVTIFFTVIIKGLCALGLGLAIAEIDGAWTCPIPQLTHYNFTISAITACVVAGILSCVGWSVSSLPPESRLFREMQEEAIKSRAYHVASKLTDIMED